MVDDKLRAFPDFPGRLRVLVEHMIISHHGQLAFGSPKVPQFPEAMLLHYLDDMDSKMECMRSMLAKDRQVEGCFTGYSSALDRTVLKKDRFLDPPAKPALRPQAPSEPVEAPPVAASVAAPAAPPAVAPAPLPVAAPERAVHPLFAGPPKSNSSFGDKLLQALQPAESKQDA
jgi:3'-5' exoribonuclease